MIKGVRWGLGGKMKQIKEFRDTQMLRLSGHQTGKDKTKNMHTTTVVNPTHSTDHPQ